MPSKSKTPSAAKKAVPAKKTTRAAVKKSASASSGKSVAKKPVAKKPATKKTASPRSAQSFAVPAKAGHGLDLVKRCVKALDGKKAASIEVIYVGAESSITDYFVIATGTSDPHLRALRIELEKAIYDVIPGGRVRIQNEPGSGWCVVDAFDVVVHVLSADQRANYNLEKLYGTKGKKIPLKSIL